MGSHPFLEPFLARADTRSAEPAWLRALRTGSSERFTALDFPGNRLEEWKTTNVRPIAEGGFAPAGGAEIDDALAGLPEAAVTELPGPRLVFVNGRFSPGLSSGERSPGLFVGNLAEALEHEPERLRPLLEDPEESAAFPALNGAGFEDCAVVLAGDGVTPDAPVSLLFVSRDAEAAATFPRTFVSVGRSARLRLVESYTGDATRYFTNAVTRVHVADNADLDHCRIQLEGPSAYHVAAVSARQGRDARYACRSLHLGGRLARNDIHAVLGGEGGWCRLDGLYVTRDEQHVDSHTTLEHVRPHCDSRELYKGILDDRSRGVFNGRIIVRREAQKTDAKQSNPNLVLSDRALANTRPQLEIYADDVKCTHGATVGKLDEAAIFYLRSRGLDRGAAERLLLSAFAGEVLESIEPEPLRNALERAVAARLPGAPE